MVNTLKYSLSAALAFSALLFVAGPAAADNEVDKAIFSASATPARPGVPSVTTTGIRITGSVDFRPTAVNVWAWTGSQWRFLQGYDLKVYASAPDQDFYGRSTYRYVVSSSSSGSFPTTAIDVDFYNPAANRWVKLSESKGYTYFSGNNLTKRDF